MPKPSRMFLFTLNVRDVDHSDSLKSDILDILINVDSYCIAKECSDNINCKYHLHCFFEFGENVYLSELRNFFSCSFDSPFDLQSVKSKRNVLKYISKEDVDLLTNIKASSLSFTYQLHRYVLVNKVFSCNHPFVVQHWNCYKFIERYHDEYYVKNSKFFYGFSQVVDSFNGWANEVCSWFNCFISSPYHFKKKHLFLYGESNVGKSTFLNRILMQVPDELIYRPSYGSFAFQGWSSKFVITVFDEFDIENFDLSMLLRYLDGSKFPVPRKCLTDLIVCNSGPVLIVSNFDLQNVPLSNRLQKVLATSPYWLQEEILLRKLSSSPAILISDDDASS